MTYSMIAIDGPAASGKSTLAYLLAKKLNYLYFDTGLMYRAVTCLVLSRGFSPTDEDAATRLAETVTIDVRPASIEDGRQYDVIVEDKDITWEIRSKEVEAEVSTVASYPGVRKALTTQQRRIGLKGQVVMVGRDIGTVVLPEAELKIYLDASPEERARRRYQELVDRGEKADYAQILKKVYERDKVDSNRAVAPLKPAVDAIIINSSQMTINEVVEEVFSLIQNKLD
ncbi:MAG TPA: (d)CMP kinase [Anaerolineales bacterium]|nr:(d)CMP kinase [Anaerolineales bacterium]